MPSTLVLNADSSVCPALGTWIGNNAELLRGFSLLIAEDVLAELSKSDTLDQLSITTCRDGSPACQTVITDSAMQGETSSRSTPTR